MDWPAIIQAIGGLAGLAGLITAVGTYLIGARKTEVAALRETIAEMRDENRRLSETVKRLEQENNLLKEQIDNLERENEQLRRKLGMSPFRKTIKGLATRDDTL